MASAISTTVCTVPCPVIWLTIRPASTGVATPISESSTITARNSSRMYRYGSANPSTRRAVPARNARLLRAGSRRIERITVQCPPGWLIPAHRVITR